MKHHQSVSEQRMLPSAGGRADLCVTGATVWPSRCPCSTLSARLCVSLSLGEIALQTDSPFVVGSCLARSDRIWESALLKSRRKASMLWSASFLKEVLCIMPFGKYFSVFSFMQFIIPHEKRIPDSSCHFPTAVLLLWECCWLKCEFCSCRKPLIPV